MTANNDRAGALAALSLLVLGLAVMLGLAAAPYLRLAAVGEETAERRHLLAALEAQSARQARAGGNADPGAVMIEGGTRGIAGAALQRLVNDRINAAGGQPSSFQLLQPQESGGMTRLALGFALRIDIAGLRDLLHAIETGRPLLFVDDIAIRMPENAATASRGDVSGALEVTMQVSGFLLKDGAGSHGR